MLFDPEYVITLLRSFTEGSMNRGFKPRLNHTKNFLMLSLLSYLVNVITFIEKIAISVAVQPVKPVQEFLIYQHWRGTGSFQFILLIMCFIFIILISFL